MRPSGAICKVVSTYDCVEDLIAEDDRRQDLEDARTRSDDIHEEEQEPTMEQNCLHNGYKELCRFIVPLRKALVEGTTMSWPPSSLLGPTMHAPTTPKTGESWIYHDYLGEVLCPIEMEWSDDEYGSHGHPGGHPNYQVTANSWFRALYPAGKFDPTHPEANLFKNFYNNVVEYFEFPPGPHARGEVAGSWIGGTSMYSGQPPTGPSMKVDRLRRHPPWL
ncbi:hypothetical protein B0H10DRAFT_2440847 [Mycena sp. CBHHK59/15]|nr:hypothetical protein B0H10DRAFT_2440847 [Mycena sp. CBHHK59/15]